VNSSLFPCVVWISCLDSIPATAPDSFIAGLNANQRPNLLSSPSDDGSFLYGHLLRWGPPIPLSRNISAVDVLVAAVFRRCFSCSRSGSRPPPSGADFSLSSHLLRVSFPWRTLFYVFLFSSFCPSPAASRLLAELVGASASAVLLPSSEPNPLSALPHPSSLCRCVEFPCSDRAHVSFPIDPLPAFFGLLPSASNFSLSYRARPLRFEVSPFDSLLNA